MKKTTLFITFLIICIVCLLSSCTTSKSVVSSNVNLNKYEYAAIINNDTYHIPAELMQYEIQLFDAVEGSGLKLISDWRINELSHADRYVGKRCAFGRAYSAGYDGAGSGRLLDEIILFLVAAC